MRRGGRSSAAPHRIGLARSLSVEKVIHDRTGGGHFIHGLLGPVPCGWADTRPILDVSRTHEESDGR
jgi:hypothetical protein